MVVYVRKDRPFNGPERTPLRKDVPIILERTRSETRDIIEGKPIVNRYMRTRAASLTDGPYNADW